MLSFLDLHTTDAPFNLAAEQFVFDCLPRDRSYFMLWQNKKAVIVGKYQNTQAEVNAAYVREHEIQVVRRLSGGGAVYHDLGNLNFTFIADAGPLGALDLKAFCQPVIKALRELGVPAELNGRNDITVGGMKISGNAQYMKQGRMMHHGTILFDSDLTAVSHALHVDEEKIHAKGIRSVRSRVTNLRPFLRDPVCLDDFRNLLKEYVLKDNQSEEYRLSEEDVSKIEEIKNSRYALWDWNYGFSPAFSAEKKRRFEGCGTVSAFLTADKGKIESLSFRGDFFSTLGPELLAERLIGCQLNADSLERALSGVDVELFFTGLDRESLIDLLLYS